MLDDLIKYKEELENEAKYVGIIDNYTGQAYEYDEPISKFDDSEYTVSEIANKCETDRVIKECEQLLKTSTELLVNYGIPFDRITLSTNPGLFCKKAAYEDYASDEHTIFKNGVIKHLYGNIINKYIPVIFRLDLNIVYVPSEYVGGKILVSINDYICDHKSDECGLYIEDFRRSCYVHGIIDIDEFAKKLTKLGYEFIDGLEAIVVNPQNYLTNYFESVDNDCDFPLWVSADFTRKRTK